MSTRILLVDDSATILMMERMLLAAARAELITAGNGVDAIAKAKAQRPDLILMDIVMPQMNGIDACKAIREDPETKHIPIILVTTQSELGSVEKGFANGCSDYITKPIDGAELLRKVRSLIALNQ